MVVNQTHQLHHLDPVTKRTLRELRILRHLRHENLIDVRLAVGEREDVGSKGDVVLLVSWLFG